MQIQLNPQFLFAEDLSCAISAEDGASFLFDEQACARLEQVQKMGSTELESTDIDLLARGALLLSAAATFKKNQLIRDVRRSWSSSSYLTVMPTEKCNFRCTYCYEKFIRGKMKEEVVEGLVRYLRQNVPRFKSFQLAWFGGEPLLHPDLIQRVSSVYREVQHRHKVRGSISVTTNGALLTEDTLTRFDPLEVDVYQISVDGPKDIHDRQRITGSGRGTYDGILANIERVLGQSHSKILLRTNMDASDPSAVERLRVWLKSEIFPRFAGFEDRVSYHVVPIWDASTTSIDGICLKEVQHFQTWMSVKRDLLAQEGQTSRDYLASLVSGMGSLACYAGKPHSVVVGPDGRLYKCTVAFDLPENQVGWLRPDGSLEIDPERERRWTGENFLSDPVCGGCAFAKSCQGMFCGLVRIQTGERPCPTPKRFYRQMLVA